MNPYKAELLRHHRAGTHSKHRNTLETKLIDELQEQLKRRERSGYGSLQPAHKPIETKPISPYAELSRQHQQKTLTHLPSHATTSSVLTPQSESSKLSLPKRQRTSPSRPGDEKLHPILLETRNLEKAILSDYKERVTVREFDKHLREKFSKYALKVETFLHKQEEVKTNQTADLPGKLEKLLKISDKLSIATKAQLSAIGASAEEIKQTAEQTRLLLMDLDQHSKGRKSITGVGRSGTFHSQDFFQSSKFFKDKLQQANEAIRRIKATNLKECEAMEELKQICIESEGSKKRLMSSMKVSKILEESSSPSPSPSPPPGRKVYSRRNLAHITLHDTSVMRALSMEERGLDQITQSPDIKGIQEKMKELQEERKELKLRLINAKNKLQMSESRNKNLKNKIRNLGGNISETLEAEPILTKDQVMPQEGPVRPRIPRLEELRKLHAESLTPTSNSAREMKRDTFGIGMSPSSKLDSLLRENSELQAKVSKYKADTKQDQRLTHHDLKFQIRFMSILELVRRFLSSLRKVQKAVGNDSELNSQKEKLESDKTELENYLKKHYKYLDKKRRQQVEKLQKELEKKGEEDYTFPQKSLRSPTFQTQNTASTGFPSLKTVTMSTQYPTKRGLSIDRGDVLHTQESVDENSSDIVTHGTPPLTSKNSDKFQKKAFVELAQEELKSRQVMPSETEEVVTYTDSRHLGIRRGEISMASSHGSFSGREMLMERGGTEEGGMAPNNTSNVSSQIQKISGTEGSDKFAMMSTEIANLKLANEALKKVIDTTNREKMKTQQDKKMKKDLDNLIKQLGQSNSLIEKVENKNEELIREIQELREENQELRFNKSQDDVLGTSKLEGGAGGISTQASAPQTRESSESLVQSVEKRLFERLEELNLALNAKSKRLSDLERNLRSATLKTSNVYKKKILEHQEQILSLTDSLKQSTDTLQKVNDEMLKMKTEKVVIQGQLKKLQKEREEGESGAVKSLEAKLKTAGDERDRAQEKLNNLQTQIRSLENVIHILKGEIDEEQEKVRTLENNVSESEKKYKAQIVELNQKLEQAEKEGEDHLLKYQRDHKKKEEQKKAEIESILNSQKEKLKSQKAEAREEKQNLMEEITRQTEALKKQQDENQKMKGALKAQANTLKEAEDNARTTISHLEQEIKSQNTLIEQFKESNQSAAGWEEKLKAREEEFNKLIKSLEDQRSELSFEIAVDRPKLEKALEELKEEEQKRQAMSKKIKQLEARNEELKEDLLQVKQNEKVKEEQKRAEVNSLKKEIDGMSKRESEWVEKVKEAEDKLKGREKEIEDILQEKEKTAQEIEFQHAAERMKLQELEKLKKDKEHMDDEALQMNYKIREQEQEIMRLGNEMEREKKHKLKDMKEQKEQFQNKIQELETQIAVLKEREEANKQKCEEKEKHIQEIQEKYQTEKDAKNELKLEIKRKQLEVEELEMQGFEYKYNIENKNKELKEMEEAMLGKSKEIEQLEAKITQVQKDSQKKLHQAQTTMCSLRSDNNKRQEREIKELEGKISQKEEEIRKMKKEQEQLLTKIEEQESEVKQAGERTRQAEGEAKRLAERTKKEEARHAVEKEKLLSRLAEKEETRGAGNQDNAAEGRMKIKLRAITKRAKQYKASLLREHQNYLMLHEDFTQTLNCIKNVATDQMTAYEIEAETSNRKVEDMRKEYDEAIEEKEILEATVKTLERENEVLGFKAKTSEVNQERIQELEEMYDAVVNERDAAREELAELKRSFDNAQSGNALKLSPQSHPEKKEYTSSLRKDLQAQYEKSNISDCGPALERTKSPQQLSVSPNKAPIRRSMSPNSKKRHTIFKTNAPAAIQLKETPSSSHQLGRSPVQSPTPPHFRELEEEAKSGISSPRLSKFGIKLNEARGSAGRDADSGYSPLSGRSGQDKQADLEEIMKRFNKYKKQNEQEKEQLAANNRQLRQDFEMKADEYAVKMKQKKQRISELEDSVKLISEAVRSHACTVQTLTPLTANETEDLKTPDDNQTIQDVLQFAEMRVQRFVALYKEPFESGGSLATRKKRSQTMLNKDRQNLEMECQDLRDELTRSKNKNKMLEMEIDEFESRNKASRKEIERLNEIIAKNELDHKRTVDSANKKGDRYKEMSKDQQMEIKDLKDKINRMNQDMETHELKIGVLKHELQQIESPAEKNKIIKELKKQNSLLNSEIQSYRRNQASQIESFSSKMFGEKSGTLRTPRKCDTDLVLSKLTSSQIKLIQKLIKQDQGNQVWLLLEVLITDLGRDQLPGFILLREEDLPGKHYHLLSARVTKKTFPRVKDNERISPLKVKSRLRDLREEKINLVEQMKSDRPKRGISPRLSVNESNDLKNEIIRAKMQRNTWEIEYLEQTQHLQKLSDFIQEINDAGAAGRYLKEIKVYEEQLAGLRRDNATHRDKIIELESTIRSKEKEISRLKNDTDTHTRNTRQEQYSFLDRTFSETDAEMIIYEFEQLERRSGGIASPILTQNEERLKEKILKLEALLAEKEDALRQVARKVQMGGGLDNDSENDKNIRSLFYRFITRCPEFDKEREKLLENIYKALGYKKTDIEDIQESRGIKTKSWKSKKNLLSIFGMKTKY